MKIRERLRVSEKFLKASAKGFPGLLLRSFGVLLLQKFLAATFGPEALPLWAHFRNLTALPFALTQEGPFKGLLRYYEHAKVPVLTAAGVLSLLIFIFFLPFYFFAYTSDTAGFLPNPLFFVLLFPFALLHLLWVYVAMSEGRMLTYALQISTGNFFALMLFVSFSPDTVNEALLLYLSGLSLPSLPSSAFELWRLRGEISELLKSGKFLKRLRLRFWLRVLGGFLSAAGAAALLDKVGDYALRELVLGTLSEQEAGLWQAALLLSDSYSMLFTSTFMAVFFPEVSRRINRPEALSAYLKPVSFKLLLISFSGLAIVWYFAPFFLDLLFSEEAVKAAPLMPAVITGDLFRYANFFLSALLLARYRIGQYIRLQFVFHAFFWLEVPALLFTESFTKENILWARALSYIFSVCVLWWACRVFWKGK